jgi:hypothetical protein
MKKFLKYSVLLCISALLFTGCHLTKPPLPTDPNNPLKRVAILPMKNDTNDVGGPDMMRAKMVEALTNRSYVVKDIKETDQILRDRMGITLGGQLSLTTPKKLGEELGVEGVLYGTLMDFDETTLGAVNVRKVRGTFQLVNTMTGQTAWQGGLGVRREMRMQGSGGAIASVLSKVSDRDKKVPWVDLPPTTTGSDNLAKSFMVGLGTKLFSKAIGNHLAYESEELARRVTYNLPWGPGLGASETMPAPKIGMPDIKMPAPPSFGYMDWEGKRNFSAVVYSTTIDKSRKDTVTMEMPIAVATHKFRMDMDMSKMMKGDTKSPISKMVMIERGDKKAGYTLYPNNRKYIVHTENSEIGEKPKVEKTKVGSEVIDNHPTDKYKVIITYKDGKSQEGFIWNATDNLNGMTIKSEVENKDFKITTYVRNIRLGTPRASLFEIPAGYTEAKGFMDLMAAEPNAK